ncbi:DUF4199 domain-containing protein [Flammeovirga kamogawensis]|uniref:DUF4199 domain-containing protein n=1 Tax=Flammeovirga kamogawensis TaxID=373891 RepID=A0ABX8GSS8_9BACT|nr:DUF4199 domain-containing protein [Flammeovirga kamogawensis]MBB6461437.1 ABC-type phosphate/phosphonate transport system permease subunit [Flammeovirga kamogawensis]QWG06332.1 DUF4199 domain-containing protein [Flammeovirga kamogawensis]TRX68160.1 DUF4199 domain-containing protein [Flammeovirga kamogawensis]
MDKETSIKPFAFKYGAITGVFAFGYSVLLTSLGKSQDAFLQYLSVLVVLTATVFAYREFKEHNEGFLKYRTGVKLGTLLGFISATISAFFNYLYIQFIDDSIIDQAVEVASKAIEGNPQITDEQYEQSIEIVRWVAGTPIPQLINILFMTFFGFLLALVISHFMKNEPTEDGYNF